MNPQLGSLFIGKLRHAPIASEEAGSAEDVVTLATAMAMPENHGSLVSANAVGVTEEAGFQH